MHSVSWPMVYTGWKWLPEAKEENHPGIQWSDTLIRNVWSDTLIRNVCRGVLQELLSYRNGVINHIVFVRWIKSQMNDNCSRWPVRHPVRAWCWSSCRPFCKADRFKGPSLITWSLGCLSLSSNHSVFHLQVFHLDRQEGKSLQAMSSIFSLLKAWLWVTSAALWQGVSWIKRLHVATAYIWREKHAQHPCF